MKLFSIFFAIAVFLVVGLPRIINAANFKSRKTWVAALALFLIAAVMLLFFGGKRPSKCYGLIAGDPHPMDSHLDLNALLKNLQFKANQGDAQAQADLGEFYQYGYQYGYYGDSAEALKWTRKAAEQGNAKAQFNLAVAYETSGSCQWYESIDHSLNPAVEAYFWGSLAALRDSQYTAASERFSNGLTPEQIAVIKKRVSNWKPESH